MAILNGHNKLFKMAITTDLKVCLWPKELWLTSAPALLACLAGRMFSQPPPATTHQEQAARRSQPSARHHMVVGGGAAADEQEERYYCSYYYFEVVSEWVPN